jgi:hypothetical protein
MAELLEGWRGYVKQTKTKKKYVVHGLRCSALPKPNYKAAVSAAFGIPVVFFQSSHALILDDKYLCDLDIFR